jgi:hypothetical protein
VSGPTPRRARWALGGAAAVFVAAAVAAAWSVPSLLPERADPAGTPQGRRVALRLGEDSAIEPQVQAARRRVEPALTERFDGARGSLQPVGWEMDAVPSLTHVECWHEDGVTGCDLLARVGGAAAVPPAGGPRLTAMNRLLAGTDTALARQGWRCDRTLAGRRPAEPPVWQATCRSGVTSLRVTFWPRARAQVGKPRQPGEPAQLSLDIEATATVYSSARTV